MRPFWKKMLSCAMAFVCLTGAAAGLTGCHGSKERAAFEVPESFDTTKQYEITFWAKNDTNIRQTDIYKKTIADFETLYPNITVNLKPVSYTHLDVYKRQGGNGRAGVSGVFAGCG